MILLDGCGGTALGKPDAVLKPDHLGNIYGCAIRRVEIEGMPFYVAR